MALSHSFKIHGLILVTTLSAVTGFVSPAFGEETRSYLIDLNSRQVTLVGMLGGGDSIANAFNDAGRVVGQSATAAGERHAFITGPNGVGMTDLGTLGGKVSLASGINDAGQVVGQATTAAGEEHAFITGPNGVGMTNLGKGTASAINDAGQVIGRSETDPSGRTFSTFITGPNGVGMTNLSVSEPYAINNAGQVVGESYTAAGEFHAFITGPNGVGATDLGSLGGALTYSSARDINEIGQVVGISNRSYCDEVTGVCSYHAFITGPNGVGMTDLGTLGGGYSSASGINDAGQVVGESYTATGERHAFITGPNGVGMTDLNSLVEWPAGIVLREAVAINNEGQVLVTALIPEPQSYALMLVGLNLVGFAARRKKAENLVKRY